jgi:predicted outer membrane repeat protein
MRRGRGAAVLVGLVLVGAPLAVVVASTPAGSATSCAGSNTTVTSNADTGAGTLRTAITNANTNGGAQTICIDTTLVFAPIVLASNLPVYTGATSTEPLTIQGNGATLNGNGHQAIVSGSSGLLTVDELTVTGSSSGEGGGILGAGAVTVTNSTVNGNTASGDGGGILGAGAVTVTNSTVNGNTASGLGGGIRGFGAVTVTNSTVSGNTAAGAGGGISSPEVTLVYTTVVQNSAGGAGAQLIAGTLTSFASVVAQPRGAAASNCSVAGTTTSNGFNFSDDASGSVSCKFNAVTDHVGASNDPMLGGLSANGGPTNTMVPNPGSPLIDGVPAASCADGAAGITTDQRGFARPDTASPNCDIGAVEVQPVAPVVITPLFTG